MSGLTILLSLGMPMAMVIGVIMAWRLTKKEAQEEEERPRWRDDSLDDWRRDRDASAEAERVDRSRSSSTHAGETAAEAETKKHQRIGG